MLTSASSIGSATDTRTSTCAARWKIDLGLLPLGECHQLGPADVEVVDRERVPARAPRIGQVREASGREVVDDVDLVTLGQQPVDEVRPDEARATRDERAHQTGSGTLTSQQAPRPAR